MSCITPFLSEWIYLNMRNGIAQDNKDLYAESIHFLNIPNYEEKFINERIEKMVLRMQSAIEIGRKIRDQKNISVKNPLRSVTLIEGDKEAADDFQLLKQYI